MSKLKHASKQWCLNTVAEYIVNCENNEYDSYVSYCEENGLEPNNINDSDNLNHVYALALVGLGLKFPSNEVK